MTKHVHNDVLDGGLNVVKNSATKMLLVSSFSTSDNVAALEAKKYAEVTTTSTDYTIGTSGTSRVLTVASKPATASQASSNASSPDWHVVWHDGTRVLMATDETTASLSFGNGASLTFPTVTFTATQPI